MIAVDFAAGPAYEVVIAGEPESCRRVIKQMGCKHYPLGLDLAIHCSPTRLEYERIVDLYTLPLCENPGIKFYSSSCYKPIPLRSKSVAHSIAKAYSETVDFPRLVNQAYEDGARLFIELGSRKFCCNLIDRILGGKDHLAMAINVKGTKDQASLVRVLAQLVSHRVPVDLSPLF
jgi:PfaB family protein